MKKDCLILRLKAITSLLLLIFVFLLLPFTAEAVNLAEYERKLSIYQSNTVPRAQELRQKIENFESIEDGLARQNGIPVSRVIKYELLLEEIIDYYHSIPFLQKRMLQPNTFLIDSERIEEFLLKKPPYSLLLYLRVLEDLEKCNAAQNENKKTLLAAKNSLKDIEIQKIHYEREYRIRNAKIERGEGDILLLNWQLLETKARLEQAFVARTFYVLKQEMAQSHLKESETKLKTLEPLVAKIRENVQPTEDDYDYLDAKVFEQRQKYNDLIIKLTKRFEQIDTIKEKNYRRTSFEKYSTATEQTLIAIETGFLFDMAEYCSAMRLIWRIHTDLLGGLLGPQDLKEMKKRIQEIEVQSAKQMLDASGFIQKIREAKQETTRRFDVRVAEPENVPLHVREEFIKNLEAMKNRYLSYIVDLDVTRVQITHLDREIRRIMDEQIPEEKLQRIWYQKTSEILDFELWHFGDYPVTLNMVLRSLLALIVGLFLTYSLSFIFKKRECKRGKMSAHSILLVQKLLYYTGFLISVLLALWTLRLPFTAFAFLGGAFAIALGFGTQRIMSDFLCGTLILLQGKLRVGDFVIIGDKTGIVKEITIQNTVLLCQQCNELIIPNTKVHESLITNLTLTNSIFRSEVSVSVAYKSDVEKVSKIIREILETDKNVLKKPPFKIFFENFGESGIKFTIWFFIDLKKIFGVDAESNVRYSILECFRKEGIEIPFPQTDINIKEVKE